MTLKSKNRKVQLEFFFKEILKKSKKLLEAFFISPFIFEFAMYSAECHVLQCTFLFIYILFLCPTIA